MGMVKVVNRELRLHKLAPCNVILALGLYALMEKYALKSIVWGKILQYLDHKSKNAAIGTCDT